MPLPEHALRTRISIESVSPEIKLVSTNGSVGAPAGCPPNSFQTGNDGDMTVTANVVADFSNACVHVGQNITVTAAGAGKTCSTDVIVDLKESVVRNDFGKHGVITMTACGGIGLINIANAILVDSGANGGGSDPNAVASLNGGKKTDPSALLCSQSPACGGAVSQPVAADQADRALHHVIGVPRCDTLDLHLAPLGAAPEVSGAALLFSGGEPGSLRSPQRPVPSSTRC